MLDSTKIFLNSSSSTLHTKKIDKNIEIKYFKFLCFNVTKLPRFFLNLSNAFLNVTLSTISGSIILITRVLIN